MRWRARAHANVVRHEKPRALFAQEAMTSEVGKPRLILAPLLGAFIVISWFICSMVLGQSPLVPQTSTQLLSLGAANGVLVQGGEWWRLLTSQFLHVHAPHMLFNALCVAILGGVLERRSGWFTLALVFFIAGTLGQVASVIFYPSLVSSGASQALMALCGAALVTQLPLRTYVFVLAVLAAQVALDIQSAHIIKAGHGVGFVAGLCLGALLRYGSRQGANHVAQQPHAARRDA
jgi:rhomboid protease GluP